MRSQAPREATDAYASGEMVGVIPLSKLKDSSSSKTTRILRNDTSEGILLFTLEDPLDTNLAGSLSKLVTRAKRDPHGPNFEGLAGTPHATQARTQGWPSVSSASALNTIRNYRYS